MPWSGTAWVSSALTIRFVLVPISVHMPARITMWFIGSRSFEIENPKRAAHSWATGMNSATTGVLLITLDSAPVASISLLCATASDRGRPSTQRDSQFIAPVSRKPTTTMYSAAMVITPELAKPCRAWSGFRMPSSVSTIIAPTSTTSVSSRVAESSTSTPNTTPSVRMISKFMGCAGVPVESSVQATSASPRPIAK